MGGRILDFEAKRIRDKGREEGRENTLIFSIKSLMQKLNMSSEEAMDALSIPPSEQATYISQL